jgi:SAM-dependent methyltransferase
MSLVAEYRDYCLDDDWTPYVRREILRHIPADGTRILDVGCGTGRKSRHLVECGATVVGCDISEPGIGVARTRLHEAVVCDLTQGLPFADESFDVVFSSAVLEHIYPVQRVLAEMYRVLRPGGRVVVEVPNVAYWPNRLLLLAGRDLIWIGAGKHIRAFTRHNLAREVQRAGFVDVSVDGTILPLPKTGLRVHLPLANRLLPGLCLTILAAGSRPASCT